jgi:mxaJ protein
MRWPALLLGLLVASARADAAPLRVCADPNNLPYSNRAGQGFENELAALLAADLGRPVAYHWRAHRRGFVRNTLQAHACDVIMGVPSELERVSTSAPYYRSSYVFVTRKDGPADLSSLDDPRLRKLRVGVPVIGDDYANPPPVHALAARGIVDNVIGYSVFGDYDADSPPLELLRAVERGAIDVAIAWGPQAGYVVKRHPDTLQLRRGLPAREGPYPFEYAISIGVRKDDVALREALDAALRRNRVRVRALLEAYGVPLL